jgi:uncharacterized protein (TIGR02646 family)
MKFLKKNSESEILAENLRYEKGRSDKNRRIRELLLEEQACYCAYTEKKIGRLDSVEVEHFDPDKKFSDDYYNYYAVIRSANQKKMSVERKTKFANAAFFNSLFFQTSDGFAKRVAYISEEHIYEERSLEDVDAAMLIEYLSLNDPALVAERLNHVERLKELFENPESLFRYLSDHPEESSFPTAIEATFDVPMPKGNAE